MDDLSKFCTCKNYDCPLHPTKHEKGCAPCISKNLRLHEIPACFFNLLPEEKQRTGDTFRDFAELVLQKQGEH